MIVDSLTHVTHDGRWFGTEHDASPDRLLREMDRAGVERAVVVALAGYIENEFVRTICRRYPDRLIPGASVNPAAHTDPEYAAKEMLMLVETGYPLVKLHPRLHGYDPLDPNCLAVLEVLQESRPGFPIWLDTIFHSAACLLRKPPLETIHELAIRFPGLRFVLLHGLGVRLLELAEIIPHLPNLLIDLSHSLLYYVGSSLSADMRFMLARRDMRVIVGSDFPEYVPAEYIQQVHRMAEEEGLPQSKVDHVLGLNLSALLGLEGPRAV